MGSEPSWRVGGEQQHQQLSLKLSTTASILRVPEELIEGLCYIGLVLHHKQSFTFDDSLRQTLGSGCGTCTQLEKAPPLTHTASNSMRPPCLPCGPSRGPCGSQSQILLLLKGRSSRADYD